MLRHIAWFNESPVEPDPAGGLKSTDALVGKRCLIPAREIERLGIDCSIFGNLHDADPAHVSKHLQKLNADIVVMGPMSESLRLKLARAAKHLGCYVIVDFGDATDMSEDGKTLAASADMIVTATDAAAMAILKQTHLPAIVIADSDEHPGGKYPPVFIAKLWIDCFKKLKQRPPACANTNVPE